jgi:putative FmdB family regulatory protein
MPTYAYHCKCCDHHFEESHTIANRHLPVENPCPKCSTERQVEQIFVMPGIVSGVGTLGNKAPEGFKDRLREMKKKYHGSNIDV